MNSSLAAIFNARFQPISRCISETVGRPWRQLGFLFELSNRQANRQTPSKSHNLNLGFI